MMIEQTLRRHNLRVTDTRLKLLEVFLNTDKGLSSEEIRNQLTDGLDRVTVYRTLKVFEEKGLIHSIPSEEVGAMYALCPEACSVEDHIHNHPHFTCKVCGKTTCLENYDVSVPRISGDYLIEKSDLLLKGVCPKCRN